MEIGHTLFGRGPRRVLVLHGWFGDHSAWDPMHSSLSQDEFTYAFMDYRGYGRSRHRTGRYDMAEIAADALALADRLEWGRFSLIGHSMGGMAIQRVLVEAPDRVEKLVAITPVPASGVPFDEQGWALFSGAAERLENRKAIIDFTTGSRLSSAWVDSMARNSTEISSQEAFAAYLEAWAKTDFSARVQGLPHPVLALVGEHDPALNADFVRATYLASYPNARLEVLPNCGHYPMNETPVWLATVIEKFLRG